MTYTPSPYRRHHCPVHLSATGELITDRKLRSTSLKSNYQQTFNHAHPTGLRPSLKIPPTIRHRPPTSVKHDLVTMSKQEYVHHPPQPKTTSFKPRQPLHSVGAKVAGDTSYKLDYPPREMEQPYRPANQILRTTLKRDPEVSVKDNYVTMNQALLRRWSGLHCPPPFSEPNAVLKFRGAFDGKTVFKNDFKDDIARLGRPSTSCKKTDETHFVNGEFSGETTNHAYFQLPGVTTRDTVHLRKEARKNKETMEPSKGVIDGTTQYKIEHPGYEQFPLRQGLCEPQADSLQLFRGPREIVSENQASYSPRLLLGPPRPRTSFKNKQLRHSYGGEFDGHTSFKVAFQPIPRKHIMAQSLEVDRRAALIGHAQKMGAQARQAQDYGVGFVGKTTNQSHFREWNVSPRVRHGDQSEKEVYQPPNQPFATKSETKATYVPLRAKPSDSCKPLDLRFKPSRPPTESVWAVTAYSDDFLPKPLPHREQCPAELLLS